MGYIDDVVAFAPSEPTAWMMASAVFKSANRLGMTFSLKKFKTPAPTNRAIGFVFDLPKQTVEIPVDKLEKAQRRIHAVLDPVWTTAKDTERLLGLLQWMAPIIYPSKVMLRTLTAELTQCNATDQRSFKVSRAAKLHLHWWLEWAQQLNKCSFDTVLGIFPTCHTFVYTDASDWGIGAWLHPHRRSLGISFSEMPPRLRHLAKKHIGIREAFALSAALCSWDRYLSHRYVRCFVDNRPVHDALCNLWSCNSDVMIQLRTIALAGVRLQSRFFFHWIPTDQNPVADALSRNLPREFRQAIGPKREYRDLFVFEKLSL